MVRDRNGRNRVDEHCVDVWTAAVSDWFGRGCPGGNDGCAGSRVCPPGKKNLATAITYSGVPVGSLLAALLAILLLDQIGWRGMFWIGALPLVTLLPLAFFKMPESVAWLAATGRHDQARKIPERTGVPVPYAEPGAPDAAGAVRAPTGRAGFAGLFSGTYILPTALLGLMSATGLMLVYSLNTWLPELMRRVGYEAKGSLAFLLVLNGGAIVGALIGSRLADRLGPKPVVAACFLIGALAIGLLTLQLAPGPAPVDRGVCRLGHQWYPNADLRLRGQLLPDQRPGRRCGLVCRVWSVGRCRRPVARRLPDQCRSGP